MHTNESSPSANQITWKAIITGVLILVMMIPALLVYNLVQERKQRQDEVGLEISENWAGVQNFAAPYLVIPYTKSIVKDKVNQTITRHYILLPEDLNIDGNIVPEEKKRSIFKVNIYTTDLKINGHFNLENIKIEPDENIQWSKAKICFGLTDLKGIVNNPIVKINGQNLIMELSLPEYAVMSTGAAALIDLSTISDRKNIAFDFPFSYKGTKELQFIPMGKSTKINVHSKWDEPSFFGSPLPAPVTQDAEGFSAQWQVNSINRGFPQVWDQTIYKTDESTFGVKLYSSSDHYTKVERSIKYAILLIGLTFGFFFIMELIIAKKVHPVQYVLVGIALLVFYTLLLSLGEYVGFEGAYITAAAATIFLIVMYCKNLFNSWRNAMMIGILLTVLYLFVYFIIQLEDLNLLAGSIGLFILVAVAMYLTRKIDWYKDKAEKPKFTPPTSSDPNPLSMPSSD